MNNIKVVTPEERFKIGRFAGFIGITVNLLLFVIKICVGIIFGSISAVADAINNLSDAMSSVFVLVGYILAAKPADKEHPYGHARMEYLCGLFISVIITVLGVEMIRSAAGRFVSDGQSESFSGFALVIMGLTVLFKIGLALFYRYLGKRISSQSLRASAIDSLGDVGATSAVIIGMILTPYLGSKTDAVLGALIGVYIVVLGIKLVMESSGTLIGVAPDAEFVCEISDKIKDYEGVLGIHDLVIHSYGAGKIFASVHVEVDSERDPIEAHDLIDNIEADFLRERGIVLVIHMDPVCLSDPKTNELRDSVAQIILDISEETDQPVAFHDFRVVWGVTHTNLIFDIAIHDGMPISDYELSEKISNKIRALDPTYNTVICVDRDYHSARFGKEMN